MITISIRDYTTEQLKDLAYGLTVAADKILKRYGCRYDTSCKRSCEGYAICTDLSNTWCYLYKNIRSRERVLLEVPRDTQESK